MAKIHIADDEADIRQLLSFMLTEDGHEVSTSGDGHSCIERMLMSPPHLLILDLMMPEMDGYSVLQEMADYQILDHTKILVLTAKAAEQDRERGYELGADEYVTKPCDEGELRTVVMTMLDLGKEELKVRREDLKDKARLFSQLESVVEQER